ncbi:MAG: hypothetical protein JXR05_11195 [Flavobacteriaceae bacterium]
MDVNPKTYNFLKKIEFTLIFFCLVFVLSCQQATTKSKFNIAYDIEYDRNQNAATVTFKASDDQKQYSVRLKGQMNSILGEFTSNGNHKTFKPIIPFTAGETYEIIKNNKLYLEFSIVETMRIVTPKLSGIYPKSNTLPENLLKMYFVFNTPMQQSQSTLKFIKVFEQESGREIDVFLPLENELWNTERTQLTLWLDPGRIKKDLIPNKEKGIPIKEGNSYTVVVDSTLQSQDGIELGKFYVKRFLVGERDRKSPNSKDWKITPPEASTGQGLGILFDETLDYMLIEEMILIYDEKSNIVEGDFLTSKKATNTLFIPKNTWKKGTYRILINSQLEDLAGNNFNRLFDRDLNRKPTVKPTRTKTISFTVE